MDLYSVDTKGRDYEDVWITDQVIWKWRPGNGTKAFRGTAFWGLFPLIPVLACPHKPPLVQLARLWSVRLTMSPSQDCKLRQLDTKYEMEQNNIWGSFLCLEQTVCVHNYWENLLRCAILILSNFWFSFWGVLWLFSRALDIHLVLLVVRPRQTSLRHIAMPFRPSRNHALLPTGLCLPSWAPAVGIGDSHAPRPEAAQKSESVHCCTPKPK